MSAIGVMFERVQRLPRSMQWAIMAVVGIGLYLLWDGAIRPVSASWNKDAAIIENQVREVRASDRVVSELRDRDMERLVTAIGAVRVPTSVAEGSKMFNDVVLDVLHKNGASNPNFSSRSRGKLAKTSLMEITRGVNRVDRLTGDVKFEATPRAAASIIAELESSPYIESVNSVRLTRDAGGKVKVSLTIEAWMLGADPAAAKGESV